MNKFDALTKGELITISAALAIVIAEGKTKEELRVLSSMAIAVGSLLTIASNQQDNIDAIISSLFD